MIDSFSGRYRFLSNFYPSPITDLAGNGWPTVEHAFQAMKTLEPGERREIRLADSPGKAKRLGRRVTLRPGWNDIRIDVMRRLLTLKFEQGSDLAAQLLATEDELLVEGNTWNDRFWGVCEGKGQNHLGLLLMDRRRELA